MNEETFTTARQAQQEKQGGSYFGARGRYDVLLVGVGGQGVLTIADLLSEAALRAGLPVSYYPSKGMAQRGGFVKAQVRLGRAAVGPNIPEQGADLVIALELSEALKALRYVRSGGDFLLYGDVWAPVAVMLGKAPYPALSSVQEEVVKAGARLVYCDPSRLPQYNGAPVADNVYVLALALGQTGLGAVLDPAGVLEVVRTRWQRGAERNVYAFEAGLGEAGI